MPTLPPLPRGVQPSARGLAACLMMLEQEAVALDQTLAARLIAAAADALLETAPAPGDDGTLRPAG